MMNDVLFFTRSSPAHHVLHCDVNCSVPVRARTTKKQSRLQVGPALPLVRVQRKARETETPPFRPPPPRLVASATARRPEPAAAGRQGSPPSIPPLPARGTTRAPRSLCSALCFGPCSRVIVLLSFELGRQICVALL
jgi:hypothetical protein